MKLLNSILLSAFATLVGVNYSHGSVLLSDSFDYTNGNLVGQGSWTETAAVTPPAPAQVSNGNLILTTGQDIYKALPSVQTLTAGETLYFTVDFSISSVTATGDYFFHVTPTVGNASLFYARLWARSSASGYVLGLVDTSTGSTYTFGSSVLSFSTDYQAVISWTSVSGDKNDTFKIYVDPVSGVESENTPYLSHTWTSTTSEPTTVAAINFRQGNATNAPVTSVHDVVVATTFHEAAGLAAPVPEPSSAAALAGLVVLGAVATRRRRA